MAAVRSSRTRTALPAPLALPEDVRPGDRLVAPDGRRWYVDSVATPPAPSEGSLLQPRAIYVLRPRKYEGPVTAVLLGEMSGWEKVS